jgi:hypothetical protein
MAAHDETQSKKVVGVSHLGMLGEEVEWRVAFSGVHLKSPSCRRTRNGRVVRCRGEMMGALTRRNFLGRRRRAYR